MKKLFMVLPLVFLLCFTFGCQKGEEVAEEPVVDVEADIAAINELWNQYGIAYRTGDLDLWMSLWTDEGIRMIPDMPEVVGKEQIRSSMQGMYDMFNLDCYVKNKEARIADNWAVCRGSYTGSITPKAGGNTIRFIGKYMSILERQEDGSWKIARDCASNDAPIQSNSGENQ